jgi:hypothetical protein
MTSAGDGTTASSILAWWDHKTGPAECKLRSNPVSIKKGKYKVALYFVDLWMVAGILKVSICDAL